MFGEEGEKHLKGLGKGLAGAFKKVVKGTEAIVSKIDHEAGKLIHGGHERRLRDQVEKDAQSKSPEKVVSNE